MGQVVRRCKAGDRITIGDDIAISVTKSGTQSITLAIDAPRSMLIGHKNNRRPYIPPPMRTKSEDDPV